MSELLQLPAPQQDPVLPQTHRQGRRKRPILALIAASVVVLALLIVYGSQNKELLANVTLGELQLESSLALQAVQEAQAVVIEKNLTPVTITIQRRGGAESDEQHIFTTYQELGFEYALNENFLEKQQMDHITPFFQDGKLKNAADVSEAVAQLTVDESKWDSFVDGLDELISQPAVDPELTWTEGEGWVYQEAQAGVKLHQRSADRAFEMFVQALEQGDIPTDMTLVTQASLPGSSAVEHNRLLEINDQLQALVAEPLVILLAGEEHVLDLNAEQAFLELGDTGVSLNESRIRDWLQEVADAHYRPTNTVRIVDKVESRPGVIDAVVEGEFLEGRRMDVDEVFAQIMDRVTTGFSEEGSRVIHARSYEIPLKVYNEMEGVEYDLLSVGYSEYSKGNAPNRVHNIQVGLGRINGHLIEPGGKISFNKLSGPINNDFRVGYAIFGPVAKPSLGGGICQISTTFYRALLNLGVPITMRQNHSWDLSYYRAGGYGLDATIFPSVGLDVKAVNDLESDLYIYSYNRPESEEAFVLIYGVDDGRKVTLEPAEEYIPFYGSKTLKWTQTVEKPDGVVIQNDIISRYRM